MNKLDLETLRASFKKFMNRDMQSMGYYARRMDMTTPTLIFFLNNDYKTSPSELTTRKIVQYLDMKGIQWDKE